MAETPNIKCSNCRCYWIPDETDIKSSGLQFKTCKKCRENFKKNGYRYNCEHDKIKSNCRECGGSAFCIHNKQKSVCRDCKGGSICSHDKIKSNCRHCKGGSICIHDKRKTYCRECGGSSICIHDKRKSNCRDCKGGSFCTHDREKSRCKECGGSSICIHDKEKRRCKECNLQLYLIHLQRMAIYRCIKSSKLEKTKPSIEYLGCSAEYFKEYLKKKMDNFNQFSEIEMTWDNIHIDHIKPINSFNLDDVDEFLTCCHYTNLQPLLAEVNLNKNCKWSDEDNAFWNEKIKDKEYYDIYIPK